MQDTCSDFSGWLDPPTVGIIGGLGAMGRVFYRFFASRGMPVLISDQNTSLSNQDLIDRSDVVLVSVPLHRAVEILEELCPCFRPRQLVLDICSLKVEPMRALDRSAAWFVGLHPMYGPYVSDFHGQTMIACRGRVPDAVWDWLWSLFEGAGLKIHECTPEEHDRMMTVIQLIPHMATVVLGHCLRTLDVPVQESLRYTSPIYRLELDLIGRLFAQDPQLYAAISMKNPFRKEALEAFQSAFERSLALVRQGNWHEFIEDFRRTSDYLGGFCAQALQETNRLLTWHQNNNSPERSGKAPSPTAKKEGSPAPEILPGVSVGRGLGRSLSGRLRERFPKRRPVIFVDRRVADRWREHIQPKKAEIPWIEWDATEANKRLAQVEKLARKALAVGADRRSVFVAVGGGVTGDVIGFLASVFMRGVPVVQVPTTLLAQVDSCLGGKTGVDLDEGKNLVGTFHHPTEVLVDPDFLATLPECQWQNGLAEVIKYGFLEGGRLMEILSAMGPGPTVDYPLPARETEDIIKESLRIKHRYVAADEKDHGLRQFLNLGHTTGHALEALSGYSLAHGHAVGLGIRVALRIGVLLGATDPALEKTAEDLLKAFGLPRTTPLAADVHQVLTAMRHDKKKGAGGLVWVIPRRIGQVERFRSVSDAVVLEALEAICPE
ncbi:3-dehydroquinate synthase [Desulfacinum hydrothermale DSM 13146]|uniref:3-dehydroquinate synthase n=1 Tax=Desulfacinum hydrothermale DSM 13146 TaxID=1121390 RepID=A0A1W1X4I8_9BACT|nr:3-dehydroquinate synthase [Desulfacinum hydrothermale]SMC18889.1 3-dehydroquinate synthase [Desulfacinum hydrothermale DSM 13146]